MAHTYKSIGPITVQYHADPDDLPVAGVGSTLNFFITDKSQKFVLADCYCRVIIQGSKGAPETLPLNVQQSGQPGTDEALAWTPYTFAKNGAYTIKFLATSKRLKGFAPISANYVQHVDAVPAGPGWLSRIPRSWIIFASSLGVLGLMALLIWGQREPEGAIKQPDDPERFKSPVLHYGFYVMLGALAILTLFANTVHMHSGH